MNYPVTIVAMVVDTHNLTMYKEDGSTITVPQGDPRIRELVEKLTPVLFVPGQTYQLTAEEMEGKNHYADVEKKSNGLVRFFKMAKNKFKEIAEKFCPPIKSQTVGSIPRAEMTHTVINESLGDVSAEVEPPEPKLPSESKRPLTKSEAAVAEIMANAVNTSDGGFQIVTDAQQARQYGKEEEIIVAVLPDNTVVHGVEKLSDQMKAVSAGVTSIDGMQLFLNRAATVKRGHSVEDLLKFVQKGELPFADDGTVLVYKRLNPTGVDGMFVDCHSGNVKQKVGSFVHMAENLVDPNRSRDCSNGLHVARRDYLSSFSGSVVVLCKLAPEDVIAVPHNDARKLRAKGYHIIARLNDEDAKRVCSNKPMLDTELLANAIAGNHAPILEYVEITEQKGGGLKVTKVESPQEHAAAAVRAAHSLDHLPENKSEPSEVNARELALSLNKPAGPAGGYADGDTLQVATQDEQLIQAPPGGMVVESEPVGEATPVPASVNEQLEQDARAEVAKPAVKLSEKDQLLKNWWDAAIPSTRLAAAQAILDFKKSKKKSWTALGIPGAVWMKAQEIVEGSNPKPVEPVVEVTKRSAKTVLSPVAAAVLGAAKPSTTTSKNTVKFKSKPAPAPKEKKMTQQEQMSHLVELYNRNPDKQNAKEIVAFKQKTKKSWDVLGVTDAKFIKKITERAKL